MLKLRARVPIRPPPPLGWLTPVLGDRMPNTTRRGGLVKKAMYGKTATRVALLLATVAALGSPKKW